jgi:hypothetical protein
MESMLRHINARAVDPSILGLLALFCGSSALAGSESAARGKLESIEVSVCRLIEMSARTQSLPVAFLTRLIWQESSFRLNTISPAGAQGIAQFMPTTADERGLANPFDPEEAIPNPPNFSPTSSSVSVISDWPPRPTMPVLSACKLARRPRQFADRDPGLRSDHHATSGPVKSMNAELLPAFSGDSDLETEDTARPARSQTFDRLVKALSDGFILPSSADPADASHRWPRPKTVPLEIPLISESILKSA